MGLDPELGAFAGLTPSIPASGLLEVLSSWSGRGQLLEALACPDQPFDERRWRRRDVERRVNRVIFERLAAETALESWPKSGREWVEILPVTTNQRFVRTVSPGPNVDWVRTRLGPWPPSSFVRRRRRRVTDLPPLRLLRWTMERSRAVWADAQRLDRLLAEPFVDIFEVVDTVLDVEPLATCAAEAPRSAELRGIRSEGALWRKVASVARFIADSERQSVAAFARAFVAPDENLHWRLFHLAVFGEVLNGLRGSGATLSGRAPLQPHVDRPNYVATMPDGREVDVWFEAAGAWDYYEVPSPYVEVTGAVAGSGRPLGADILLVALGERAMVFECKYSENPAVIRSAYSQIITYAAEVQTHLAPRLRSIVVGPAETVTSPRDVELGVGPLTVAPPREIESRVRKFWST